MSSQMKIVLLHQSLQLILHLRLVVKLLLVHKYTLTFITALVRNFLEKLVVLFKFFIKKKLILQFCHSEHQMPFVQVPKESWSAKNI